MNKMKANQMQNISELPHERFFIGWSDRFVLDLFGGKHSVYIKPEKIVGWRKNKDGDEIETRWFNGNLLMFNITKQTVLGCIPPRPSHSRKDLTSNENHATMPNKKMKGVYNG